MQDETSTISNHHEVDHVVFLNLPPFVINLLSLRWNQLDCLSRFFSFFSSMNGLLVKVELYSWPHNEDMPILYSWQHNEDIQTEIFDQRFIVDYKKCFFVCVLFFKAVRYLKLVDWFFILVMQKFEMKTVNF